MSFGEILRWISMVLMWCATALNIFCFVRGLILNKKLRKVIKSFEALVNKMGRDLTKPEE